MNRQLIIKALYSHRKAKFDILKNNYKNCRTNLIEVNKKQILEIYNEIKKLEKSNFLRKCTDKILIAINGYKTPKSVIEKLQKNDLSYLISNPKFKQKNQ